MPQRSELFVEVPMTSVVATFVGGRGDCALVEAPGTASLLGVRVACLYLVQEGSSAVVKSPHGSTSWLCH